MIALFVNGRAGKATRRQQLHAALRRQLGAEGEMLAPASIPELQARMRGLFVGSTPRPDTIAICGGDGTLRAVATALLLAVGAEGSLPTILLLPAGTINTTAKNLGIPRAPVELLTSFLAARKQHHDVPRKMHRMLRLETVHTDTSEQMGSVFGAAMVGRFFEMYSGLPHRGAVTVAKLGIRITASALVGGHLSQTLFAPTVARLAIDGSEHDRAPYTLLLASTLPEAGLHLRPTYRGGSEDGFHLVASGMPARTLARQLPRVLRGTPLVGEPHIDTMAKHVRFTFERTEPCMLDGDSFLAQQVTVRQAPPLTFLVPLLVPLLVPMTAGA